MPNIHYVKLLYYSSIQFGILQNIPCWSSIKREDGATARFLSAPSNACWSLRYSKEFCLIPKSWIKVQDVPLETSSVQCVSLHAKFPIAKEAHVSSSGSSDTNHCRNVSRYDEDFLFSYMYFTLLSWDKIRTKRLHPFVRCSWNSGECCHLTKKW